MPRIQFSDVTPPDKKRSIRDIPIPNNGRRKTPITIIKKEIPKPEMEVITQQETPHNFEPAKEKISSAYEYYYPKESKFPSSKPPKKHNKKPFIFGGLTLIVIFGFIFSMMTIFASATVTITPKNQDITVDLKSIATKDEQDGTIKYEVIKLAKSKTISVPATGEEAVELKASGKIIIYNDFSTEPQRLIVRTRFQNPEGLIYRIPESVIVPGKKGETPGSIEVTIFADEAGEKYNTNKTDFTIPGFKNDKVRYKSFYARSSTEMTGGFVGKMKTVSEADKKIALQKIEDETETELKKELDTKVPAGLVLVQNAIIFESKDLPIKEDGSNVSLGKEVTAYAVMLNSKNLSNKITNEYITNEKSWVNIKAEILDFSGLKLQNLPKNISNAEKIDLQISGQTRAWAQINTEAIQQKLIGISKKDVVKLMDEFAGISSITSTVRPIWKQSFPSDAFKIHVKTVDTSGVDTK